MVPPTLLFNAIVIAWFVIALNVHTAFAAFGLLHLIVGLWLALHSASRLLNKTTVIVPRSGPISVAHGPIPVLRRRTVEGRVVQLHGREGRPSLWTSWTRTLSFELWATLEGGKRQCLLAGIDDVAHARYLEQEIERFLGLEHLPLGPRTSDGWGVGGGGPSAPYGVEVVESSSSITIRMSRRYNTLGLGLAGFSLLFIAAGAGTAIAGILQPTADISDRVGATVIGIVLSLTGALMLYQGLVGTVNATTVVVDGGGLSVRNGPLPVRGGTVSIAGQIVQVFCRCASGVSHLGRHPSQAYDVYVILSSGERIRIVRAIGDEDHADYVERKIENFLRIEDRAVRGEMRRSRR